MDRSFVEIIEESDADEVNTFIMTLVDKLLLKAVVEVGLNNATAIGTLHFSQEYKDVVSLVRILSDRAAGD